MRRFLNFVLAFVVLIPAAAQQNPDFSKLLQDPAVRAALDATKANEPSIIEEQIRLSEIPAPAFKEETRAAAVLKIFRDLSLKNVRMDKAGNVIGERPGLAAHPNLVFSAHLDTVFPEGTDVKVKREGTILKGPGIGDDARGLAVIIAVAKALNQANVQTQGTITFVADVGEEGLGDLRGMKQLFNDTMKDQIDRFVSVDETGFGIYNIGVGSYRYKITFRGPGGHSYNAFGLVNPIHALGRAIAIIADFQVPTNPKTTFNVGRVGGGTSINSIAPESWMEMDMRSSSVDALKAIDATFLKAVDQALTEENARWGKSGGSLVVDKQKIGDRPAGNMPENSGIVQTAISVTKALGATPKLQEGSSDANVPMALQIPAIMIGGGGKGEGAHSPTESFDTTNSWLGTQRAVLLVIALSQK
jgi:acetylornithine deacetylase/succinyl-diaminopimelate desuccinylase-like protein